MNHRSWLERALCFLCGHNWHPPTAAGETWCCSSTDAECLRCGATFRNGKVQR